MRYPTIRLILTLMVLLAPVAGYAEDFTLAMAVPLKDDIRTIRFETKEHVPSFHVVLTNTAGKDLRIWQSGNSWGYGNLSFEWMGKDGKTLRLERGLRVWYWNFASYLTLTPGEQHVFDVWFPDDWKNVPSSVREGDEVTLRAVFSIPPDKNPEKLGVWSGTVRSPEVKVVVQDAR